MWRAGTRASEGGATVGLFVSPSTPGQETEVAELVDRFKRNMPADVREFRHAREESARRILARWQPAMDLFDGFLLLAYSSGKAFHQEHWERVDEKEDPVFHLLTVLHARSCSVASEVRALLVTGHTAGALARSRTLQELAVVASLIREYGKDLATRYMEHERIEQYKAADEYQRLAGSFAIDPLDPTDFATLRSEMEQLTERYGKEFKSDYGWAAALLQKARPTFRDLELAAGLEGQRVAYILASQRVHAGSVGTSHHIHHAGGSTYYLTGPTNWGLSYPAIDVLNALLLVTGTYLSLAALEPYGHDTSAVDVRIHALARVVAEASESFQAIEAELAAAVERDRHDKTATPGE